MCHTRAARLSSPVKCALILPSTAVLFKKISEMWKGLKNDCVITMSLGITGIFQASRCGKWDRKGGGRDGGSAGGGLAVWGFFSSCSFCVPRPPWGRSIWGCSQCRAGPAAASGWPRRWCWDGSDSGCRCGTPRPSPAPGRRPARPTAAAPGTWRGCGSGGVSCGGKGQKPWVQPTRCCMREFTRENVP